MGTLVEKIRAKGAGLGGVSPGTLRCALSTNYEVQDLRPDLDLEHFGGKRHVAGFVFVLIVYFNHSHVIDLFLTAYAP